MPLSADIPIPSYLEPPTPLQNEEMDQRQRVVREKAASMMQRRIAMARLMGDANQLQAAGMDPTDARQHALLKNAGSLFPDDPEQMMKVTTQVQSALSRKAAVQSYKDEVSKGISDGLEPGEASARAWSKYGPDISSAGFAPAVARNYATEQTSASRAAALKQRGTQFDAKQAQNLELGNKKLELGQAAIDERAAESDQRAQTAAEAEAGRNTRAAQAEQGKAARAAKTVTGKLTDVQKESIRALRTRIAEVNKSKEKLDPNDDNFRTKRFELSARAGNLQKEIDAILAESAPAKEDKADAPAADAAAPSGKRLKYNPKTGELE